MYVPRYACGGGKEEEKKRKGKKEDLVKRGGHGQERRKERKKERKGKQRHTHRPNQLETSRTKTRTTPGLHPDHRDFLLKRSTNSRCINTQ